ncbi:matrixin family metalloprotease [Aquimarina sp. TRL1]|uniref:matrixin family metalloprotease n=1 Tax=Aquimarina sp. (strain TRL1) TaxID=2736252 RepID=UPI00158A883D|nr:matrixin family metalloprotease [Aquimarina sp. TRL1]QKX03596.1 matrixin family metalloprotease [Aquimarina sp. TRL1]
MKYNKFYKTIALATLGMFIISCEKDQDFETNNTESDAVIISNSNLPEIHFKKGVYLPTPSKSIRSKSRKDSRQILFFEGAIPTAQNLKKLGIHSKYWLNKQAIYAVVSKEAKLDQVKNLAMVSDLKGEYKILFNTQDSQEEDCLINLAALKKEEITQFKNKYNLTTQNTNGLPPFIIRALLSSDKINALSKDNLVVAIQKTPQIVKTEEQFHFCQGPETKFGPISELIDQTKSSAKYALQGSKWRRRNGVATVPWYFDKSKAASSGLTVAEQERIIKEAFVFWEDVTNLKFPQASTSNEVFGTKGIEILFGKHEHGDGDPFDGPGGTLAHAYFPQYGGDCHFDDSENFTDNTYIGTNLLQVAIHEFGHSLGLRHSENSNAIMAAFYRGYTPNVQLDQDDINGIQALYGTKSIYKNGETYKVHGLTVLRNNNEWYYNGRKVAYINEEWVYVS